VISHVPDLLQIARPFIRPPMILPVLPWLIGVDGQNRAFRQIVVCRTIQTQDDHPGLHLG
jgi:hypothetical protein